MARFIRRFGRSGPIDLPVDTTVTAQLEVFVPPVVTVVRNIGGIATFATVEDALEVEMQPVGRAVPQAIGVEMLVTVPAQGIESGPADEEVEVSSTAMAEVSEVEP